VADLTYRRRILEVVLDFFLIIFAYYLAFIVHLGLPIGEVQINQFIETVPIALAAIYFAFFVAGIYRGVWQYFSMEDGFRYLLSILAGIVLSALVIGRMIGFDVFPRGVLIDFGLLLFLIILGSRFFFRFMDRIMEPSGSGRENQVLIYGAGGGGVMALREILQNKDLNYKPVGFLDDDPILRGRSIQGLNVIGGFNNIELVLEQQSVEGVIIASKAIEKGILFPQINEICKEQGVWVRVLRLDFEPIEAQKIR